MYPYAFELERPAGLGAALATHGGRGNYLAGGQSLVQALKLRLAQPELLVDLGRVGELRGICVQDDTVTLGAMTTHHAAASSPELRRAIPALARLASAIGDPMVRNRGTIGGSVANADPAACYPSALLALDAVVVTDRAEHAARDFFQGLYQTALAPGELVCAVRLRRPRRAAYEKFRQPASRFPLAGVFVAQFDDGVRVAVTGVKPCVFRVAAFESALQGEFAPQALSSLHFNESADMLADLHASARYRAWLVGVLARRAVARAVSQEGDTWN